MPCLPPNSLRRVSRAAGDSASPSTAMGSPCAKSTSTYCGWSGACSGATVRLKTYSSRLDPRVFQDLALGRDVQEVGVDRERRLAALVAGDRDLVLVGVFEEPGARGQVPFAPRRDHRDVGRQRVIRRARSGPGRCPCRSRRAPPRRRRPPARSRSGAWRSAAGRSRCRAGRRPRRARWRETSERRNRARTPRADPR